ncbi:MAG: flavohemoglobin expression-modulating QEGLA motif protein [Planctomycetaceae bacterium]
MSRHQPTAEPVPDDLTAAVVARLEGDLRVWRRLPGGGRLSIDRRLPFLCVHRLPPGGGDDAGTQELVTGESAYLIAPSEAKAHASMARLVRGIARMAAARFGAFLILEVWAAPHRIANSGADEAAKLDANDRAIAGVDEVEELPPAPGFVIRTNAFDPPDAAIETLAGALRKIKLHNQSAEVEIDPRGRPVPPRMRPILSAAEAERIGCRTIGLEVRPIYDAPGSGNVFPRTLRRLRRSLGRAMKRSFFTFAHAHTNIRPEHYYALGRRTLLKSVWEADRRLAAISDSFDFLLQVTPVNAESAWREFRQSKFSQPPTFHYRPLAVDPALLKRQLYSVPLEKIDDPTLAFVLRQKQDELDRKITLLSDIGTRRFLWGSLQVYGRVEPALLALAEDVLEHVPRGRDESEGGQLDAAAFARRARDEIAHYRRIHPAFRPSVVVRDDIYAGLLVSGGDLLIGRETKVPRRRAEALLQHEIGTHSVTYYNGRAQPLRLLAAGFAGYDGLQEGLAVLAEYLVGGLSRPRLRLLAARVVAVDRLIEGASFVETFRLLRNQHGFPPRVAYTIAMRVYRSGGLTKDAMYLRGLSEILEYLRGGSDLATLYAGKMAVEHVPIIRELIHREVLIPPPLRPRCLDSAGAADRISRLSRGATVLELIDDAPQSKNARRDSEPPA